MQKRLTNRQGIGFVLMITGLLSLLLTAHSGHAEQVATDRSVLLAEVRESIDWDQVLNNTTTNAVLNKVVLGVENPSGIRPDFSGTWELDQAVSDDPEEAMSLASRERSRRKDGSGRGRDRRGHRGGRGMGGPPRGDERRGRGERTDTLRELMQARLHIDHRDPELTLGGSRGRKQKIRTDFTTGSVSALHGLDRDTVPPLAAWEGEELVIESNTPKGVEIQRLKLLHDPFRLQRITLLPLRDARGEKIRIRQIYLPHGP